MNRVKCWLCGQWQREDLTIPMMFEGENELICYQCATLIEEREDSLEIERSAYSRSAGVSLEEAFNEVAED